MFGGLCAAEQQQHQHGELVRQRNGAVHCMPLAVGKFARVDPRTSWYQYAVNSILRLNRKMILVAMVCGVLFGSNGCAPSGCGGKTAISVGSSPDSDCMSIQAAIKCIPNRM